MNFTIEGSRLREYDPIKQSLYQVFIPNTNIISPLLNFDEEDVTVMTRNISLPSIAIETYEAQHLGFKKIIPIKKDVGNSFTIEVESFEHKDILLFFYNWMNLIIQNDFGGNMGSMSILYPISNLLKRKIEISSFAFNGDLLNKIIFENAWPKKIDLGSRNYENSGSVKYNVDFAFDNLQIKKFK